MAANDVNRGRVRSNFSTRACLMVLMSPILLWAQTQTTTVVSNSASPQTTINPLLFPLQIRSSVVALGSRVQTPGQERATLTGTLDTGAGNSPATVNFELPNKIRVDSGARSVSSDGTKTSASDARVSEQDEDLLETLADDSTEGMLSALLTTSSLRVIATFAKLDDGSKTGRMVDIFQTIGPVQSRSDKPVRQKHFYFDSITHLLVEVDYLKKRADGSTAAVRVQRSNWTNISGQMIPGLITRIEDDKPVATFTAGNVAFSAKAADGEFSQQ